MEPYTFPTTGIKIFIDKVSQILIAKVQSKYTTPPAPVVEVELNGKIVKESNPADPDYQITLLNHNLMLEEKMRKLVISQGVVHQLNPDEKKKVDSIRSFYKESENEDLEGNDLEVFVSYVCIITPEDLNHFLEAVTGISQPSHKSDSGGDLAVPSDVSGT